MRPTIALVLVVSAVATGAIGFLLAGSPLAAISVCGILVLLAMLVAHTRRSFARAPSGPVPRHIENFWVQHPAFLIAVAAVLAAVFSRVIVAVGAPQALNFVHYPAAILAFVACLPALRRGGLHTQMVGALAAFAGFVAISALVQHIELTRALLAFMVWSEPLMLIIVFWTVLSEATPGRVVVTFLRRVVIACLAGQFVFVIAQLPSQSGPDDLQGTFIGGGTGAHVAASLITIGSMVAASSLATKRSRLPRIALVLIPVLGFALAAKGNALSVNFITITAMLLVSLIAPNVVLGRNASSGLGRIRIPIRAIVLALVGFVVVVTFVLNRPYFQSKNTGGLTVKWRGVHIVMDEFHNRPGALLWGLGPGTTASRVALQAQGGLSTAEGSPIKYITFTATNTTRRLVDVTRTEYLARSSLFAPVSSFLGLFGDLGLGGLILYLLTWVPLVRQLFGSRFGLYPLATASLAIVLFVFGLEAVWLEDPGFIVPVAAMLALGTVPWAWITPRAASTFHRLRPAVQRDLVRL